MYLPHRNASRDEIVTITVTPGQMIVFTNNCLHAGGSNKHNKIMIRVFGYMSAFVEDIPHGKVYPFI